MNSRRFELFKDMIQGVPAKGVLRASELEQWMIKDDLANQRDVALEDTLSILCFCRFLERTKAGEPVHCGGVPEEHLSFYRATVERLIDAGELPYVAKEQFDEAFFQNEPTRKLAA